MTRKDYELIAQGYRNASILISKAPDSRERCDAWATCVEATARMLKYANPRFDEERFLKACCETVADRNSLAGLTA